jgi:hypothetical protein
MIEQLMGVPDQARNLMMQGALAPGNAAQNMTQNNPRVRAMMGLGPTGNEAPMSMPGGPPGGTGPALPPPPPVPGQTPIPNGGGIPGSPPGGTGPAVPNSASGAGGPPVTSPNQAHPSSGGGGGGSFGANPVAAGMIRYPTQNPRFALQSAIQDRGGNPFRADPYMSLLMNSAPGLATSFMMSNLGKNAEDVQGAGGEGEMFKQFLSGALGGNNGISAALSSATSGMPGFLQQLTQIQNQMNSGSTLPSTNPFAQYIMDAMADPQGAAGLFGSLTTPFMSQRVGQSYLGGLQDVAGQGLRNRADDLTRSGEPRNFWDYLF